MARGLHANQTNFGNWQTVDTLADAPLDTPLLIWSARFGFRVDKVLTTDSPMPGLKGVLGHSMVKNISHWMILPPEPKL